MLGLTTILLAFVVSSDSTESGICFEPQAEQCKVCTRCIGLNDPTCAACETCKPFGSCLVADGMQCDSDIAQRCLRNCSSCIGVESSSCEFCESCIPFMPCATIHGQPACEADVAKTCVKDCTRCFGVRDPTCQSCEKCKPFVFCAVKDGLDCGSASAQICVQNCSICAKMGLNDPACEFCEACGPFLPCIDRSSSESSGSESHSWPSPEPSHLTPSSHSPSSENSQSPAPYDSSAKPDETKCGSESNPSDSDCCAPNGEEAYCYQGWIPVRTGVACWSVVDGTRKYDPNGQFTCYPPVGHKALKGDGISGKSGTGFCYRSETQMCIRDCEKCVGVNDPACARCNDCAPVAQCLAAPLNCASETAQRCLANCSQCVGSLSFECSFCTSCQPFLPCAQENGKSVCESSEAEGCLRDCSRCFGVNDDPSCSLCTRCKPYASCAAYPKLNCHSKSAKRCVENCRPCLGPDSGDECDFCDACKTFLPCLDRDLSQGLSKSTTIVISVSCVLGVMLLVAVFMFWRAKNTRQVKLDRLSLIDAVLDAEGQRKLALEGQRKRDLEAPKTQNTTVQGGAPVTYEEPAQTRV